MIVSFFSFGKRVSIMTLLNRSFNLFVVRATAPPVSSNNNAGASFNVVI